MARAHEILELIEAMPVNVSGLLLFGDDARSSVGVCVTGNRIAWAAATRDRRTLCSYLRQHAGLELDDAHIRALYRGCHRRGQYIGEELVRSGAIDRAGLRTALRAQAIDAMAAIEDGAGSPYFVPSTMAPPCDSLTPADLRATKVVGRIELVRSDAAGRASAAM